MKRQWIFRLTVAVGVALLAARPGFGDDKNVTNIKKPATDAKKPAANPIKPATDAQKAFPKNDQQIRSTTTPVTNIKPIANPKTATTAKPASNVKPTAIAKPAPKLNAVANSKPAPNAKPATTTNAVASVKQATTVKPVVNAKPVTDKKPAVTAKLVSPNTKPASNVKAVSNSKPVTNSKPAADVKLVVSTKATQIAKPAVTNKPIANATLAANTKNTQPQVMKPRMVKGPVLMAATKTMVTKPVQKGPALSIQLPANYEQLNLTSLQRDRTMAIMDRYAVQIRNLESQLNAMKAGREMELSAVLTPQQQAQLARPKAESQAKPSTTSGPAKSVDKKGKTGVRDTTTASAASIVKDKLAKKAPGTK
jgi:hypothetical protein